MEHKQNANSEKFRIVLQQEFLKRTAKNPRYSLRAYAKHLDIYHATLSSILAGKRALTKKSIKKLALNMDLHPEQLHEFLTIDSRSEVRKKIEPYFQIQKDSFNLISEWYYDAILELLTLSKFKPDVKSIAKKIGISTVQVQAALETLLRLELIKTTRAGYALTHRLTTNILDPNFTCTAMKKYQKTILEKSLIALEDIAKTDRDHTSMTIGMRRDDLPKVKEMIKKFRYELTEYLQRKDVVADEVYQLQISFFPVSVLDQKGSNND